MKIYHLSDLHIGAKPPRGSEIHHRRMVFRKLKETIEKGKKEGVRFFVISGDIFDSNAISTAVVREFFNILVEAEEIYFVIIPGGGKKVRGDIYGHDAYTEDSLYRRTEVKRFLDAENIVFLNPDNPFKGVGNIAFYGGFFDLPETETMSGYKYHIALLHGSFGTNPDYERVLSEKELSRYDYIAMGHYHTFKRIYDNAYYAGAFVQFEYVSGKNATSGYLEVELTEGNRHIPAVRRIEFKDAPRYIYMKILGDRDAKDFENIDFSSTYVKVSMYLEDYEKLVQAKKKRYSERIDILDGACISKEKSRIAEAIDEILHGRKESFALSEEYIEEVRETILYGLWISSKKSDFEAFLRNIFELD